MYKNIIYSFICIITLNTLVISTINAQRIAPSQKQEIKKTMKGIERGSRNKTIAMKMSSKKEWKKNWEGINMKRASIKQEKEIEKIRERAKYDAIGKIAPQTKTVPSRRPSFEIYNPYSSQELVKYNYLKNPIVSEKLLSFIKNSNFFQETKMVLPELLINIPENLKKYSQTIINISHQGISDVLSIGHSNLNQETARSKLNVKKGAKIINGLILKKGETFSFNKAMGEITEKNGFLPAPAFVRGKTTYIDGGGICHVSTALFRAAINAGLEIKERRNHSILMDTYNPINYEGIESTIFQGIQDFSFRNNTEQDLLITTRIDKNELFIILYGTKDRQVLLKKKLSKDGGNLWKDGKLIYQWNQEIKFFNNKKVTRTFRSGYHVKKIALNTEETP